MRCFFFTRKRCVITLKVESRALRHVTCILLYNGEQQQIVIDSEQQNVKNSEEQQIAEYFPLPL